MESSHRRAANTEKFMHILFLVVPSQALTYRALVGLGGGGSPVIHGRKHDGGSLCWIIRDTHTRPIHKLFRKKKDATLTIIAISKYYMHVLLRPTDSSYSRIPPCFGLG